MKVVMANFDPKITYFELRKKNSKKSSTNQSWLWKYLIWPCFIFIFEDKIALIYEMGYFLGNNAQYILKENKLKMKSWHVVPSSYVMAVASKTKVIRQNMRLESRLSSALEKRKRNFESAYCKKFKFKIGAFQQPITLQQGYHGLHFSDRCSSTSQGSSFRE